MMCCMQQFDVQESSDLCIQYVPKLLHFVSCKTSFMFFRYFFTCWLQKKNKKLCVRSSFLSIEVQLQLKSRALLLTSLIRLPNLWKCINLKEILGTRVENQESKRNSLVRTQSYIVLGWAACVTSYQRNRMWEVHSCGHLSWNCIEMIKQRSESLCEFWAGWWEACRLEGTGGTTEGDSCLSRACSRRTSPSQSWDSIPSAGIMCRTASQISVLKLFWWRI
jgi:hypothetical protein